MRKALISKHVVLTSKHMPNTPSPAVILIEDETIVDVLPYDPGIPISELLAQYSEWNPKDYSDNYLSPGIIDINARVEFESDSQLTRAAISGGVTLVLEEDSYYTKTNTSDELYSDLAKLAIVDEPGALEELELLKKAGAIAVKVYLYQPSSMKKHIPCELLEKLLFEAGRAELPLFIDPNIPDPRFHYQASPLRFEAIENRANANFLPKSMFGTFAAAVPEEIDDEINEFPTLNIRKSSYQTISPVFPGVKLNRIKKHVSSEKILEEGTEEISPDQPKQRTIFDFLDEQISENQQSIQLLAAAEQESYLYDSSKEPRSKTTPPVIAAQPALERSGRPASLNIALIKQKSDIEARYTYHIANYPVHWEVKGIDLILKMLPNHPTQVHFCGISSATAINKIRKAKKHIQRLSSEIGAPSLFFVSNDIPDKATQFKSNAPIRNATNLNLLLDLLKYRAIDCISSQHASIQANYKSPESGFFMCALNGFNSIGFSLQAVWSTLNIPINSESIKDRYILRMAKWFSLHPANILKLSHIRGSIDKGKLADIIVWNPFEKVLVNECHSGNPKMCLFTNQLLQGKIVKVYLRGKTAFQEGKFYLRGKRVSLI